jgi:hypothetical protein
MSRKCHEEGSALSRHCLEPDLAAVSLHNYGMRQREPLSGALANLLRGKEGLENTGAYRFWNPRPRVAHGDFHGVTRGSGGDRNSPFFPFPNLVFYGLRRVNYQVQNHLVHFTEVANDCWERVIEMGLDFRDVLPLVTSNGYGGLAVGPRTLTMCVARVDLFLRFAGRKEGIGSLSALQRKRNKRSWKNRCAFSASSARMARQPRVERATDRKAATRKEPGRWIENYFPYSDLHIAKVGNAGLHHFQFHFDEIVLYAARLRRSEDFFPIQ